MRRSEGAWMVAAMLATACGGSKRPVEVKVVQHGKNSIQHGLVRIEVKAPSSSSKVRFQGQEQQGAFVTFTVAAASLPQGQQQLSFEIETDGEKQTVTAAFDRKPVEPHLHVTAGEGAEFFCRGEWCPKEGKLKGLRDDGSITLRVTGTIGQTVEVAGQKLVIPEKQATPGRGEVPQSDWKIDLKALAADVPLHVLTQENPWKEIVDVPVKLTAESSKEVVLGIGISAFRRAVAARAAEVTKGPLDFGAGASAGGKKSLLHAGPAGSLAYFGAPGTLRSVDLVAVSQRLEPRAAGSCGPYEKVGAVAHQSVDERITVYDRRSGAKVAERTFTASAGACPTSWVAYVQTFNGTDTGVVTGVPEVRSFASPEAIAGWLRGQVR